jgi:hypothetical protein
MFYNICFIIFYNNAAQEKFSQNFLWQIVIFPKLKVL